VKDPCLFLLEGVGRDGGVKAPALSVTGSDSGWIPLLPVLFKIKLDLAPSPA
jgi:hypothetical protein